MKKAIALAVIFAASGAFAQTAPRQATKGAIDAGKALRGGNAAIGKAATGAKALDASTAAATIMKSTMASDQAVGVFKGKLAKIAGLNNGIIVSLETARRVTAIDDGCTDKPMAPKAYENFAVIVGDVASELARAGETTDGLARIAKNSDINGDGTVDAQEDALSKRADETLRTQANRIVDQYGNTLKVDRPVAIKAVKDLATACGLNTAYAARL